MPIMPKIIPANTKPAVTERLKTPVKSITTHALLKATVSIIERIPKVKAKPPYDFTFLLSVKGII